MERRDFLRISLTGLGAVATFFSSIPFVKSFMPSAKAKALGNPVEVDLTSIEPGNVHAVLYRGETMLVLRRTKEMLATLATTDSLRLDTTPDPEYADPDYVDSENRAISNSSSSAASARTWAACRSCAAETARRRSRVGGQAASSAPAINRATTMQAGSSEVPHRVTCRCRPIGSRARRGS